MYLYQKRIPPRKYRGDATDTTWWETSRRGYKKMFLEFRIKFLRKLLIFLEIMYFSIFALFGALFILTRCEILQDPVQGSFRSRQRNIIGERRSKIMGNPRQGRFLSLFTFVQFSNQACVGATGDNGTCVSAPECVQKGGTSNGPCAGGFGTCCMFLATCGSTIRENGTYFVQSGYPNQYDGTGSCQVTLVKTNPDVCQYRLDFDQFSIMGPETTNNICNNDQFIVSGGTPIPPICGMNVGNHLYVDAGTGASSPVTLSVVTSGPMFPRNWKIRVSQIPCSSIYRAEEGCLQYFTGVAGQIRSFNYEPTSGLQLSNQDYSICIRNERNFCGIQYTQCDDPVHNRSQSFTLSGNSNNAVQAMVGSTGSANFCQGDYLIVPMAMNVGRPPTGPSVTVDRICGGVLAADVTLISTPVRSTVKPFRLWFHTDSVEAPGDVANKGFCLNYVQQPCTNNLA